MRHGIVSADIPPSPFYETQWTTENHLRKLYNGYVFARVMGEFRKGRRCTSEDELEGNMMIHADNTANFSIAGQRNTVKKGTRKLMFLACWQEGDELFEEWLEPFDITKYFPKDAAAILSKYRRAGNVAKADTPEPGECSDFVGGGVGTDTWYRKRV